jgi:hypothetical protein
MNLFRMGHDPYGQSLIDGLSWDLLTVAFWAGVVIIVAHLIIHALGSGKRGKRGG